jgi:hypothetical protein
MNPTEATEEDDLYSGPPPDPLQVAYEEARSLVLHNRHFIQNTRAKMARLLMAGANFQPRLFDVYVESHKQAMELDTVFLRRLIEAFLNIEENKGLSLEKQYEVLEGVLRQGT